MSPLIPFFFFILLFTSMDIAAQKQHEIILDQNFQKHFDEYGVKGSVIIFDASTNTTYYYDKPRANSW